MYEARINRKQAISIIDNTCFLYKIDIFTKKFAFYIYDYVWMKDKELKYISEQTTVALICLLLSHKFIEDEDLQLIYNNDINEIVDKDIEIINGIERYILSFLDYNIFKLYKLYTDNKDGQGYSI